MKNQSTKQRMQNAPKYVLFSKDRGYLANEQGFCGVRFTPNASSAMQYSTGFDNPSDKIWVWNTIAKIRIGQNITFEVINL